MKYILLIIVIFSFSFSNNFIDIYSKHSIKKVASKIEKEILKKKFKKIKTIKFKNTGIIIILFQDPIFLKKFNKKHSLLKNLPFKIVISKRVPTKKNSNKTIISYQDFSELKRYKTKHTEYIDDLSKRMVNVIKNSKL